MAARLSEESKAGRQENKIYPSGGLDLDDFLNFDLIILQGCNADYATCALFDECTSIKSYSSSYYISP